MMKINFDIQQLCSPRSQFRGIHYYEYSLLNELVKDPSYTIFASFFDHMGERKNKDIILKNIGDRLCNKLILQETRKYSYRDLMTSIIDQNKDFINYTDIWNSGEDIVHFPTGQFIPERIGKRAVVTVHDVIPLIPLFSGILSDPNRQYLEFSLENIRKNKDIEVIADSECTKNDLVYFCNIEPERIHRIYLSYDENTVFREISEEIIRHFDLNMDTPYILYIGALAAYKGIREILDAFIKIRGKYDAIKMIFAGNLATMDENVKNALKKYPYKGDLIFAGAVTEREKRCLLSNAKAFVFPSYYEGFGIPVLEAMACGCPVITTNCASVPEIAGTAVMYVDRGNADQLAGAIDAMLEDECTREKYRRLGYQQVRKFSWSNTVNSVKHLYKMIMDKAEQE